MSGTLRKQQQRLQAAILGKEHPDWPGLEVYRNAYRLRLTEALEADYPMLARWLGPEGFARLAQAYLETHPSRHFSIRWISRHLPNYLERHGPAPWAEMAAFEWALSLAFDCADAGTVTAEELAAVPPQNWPELRMGFHPSVQVLALRFPVPQVWKALQRNGDPPPCEPRDPPRYWLVWRRELKQYFRSMTMAEAGVLRKLQAGEPFSRVCEHLSKFDLPMNTARQLAEWLHRWVSEGLVVTVAC